MSEEEQREQEEELAPFFATEMRENWLKLVSSACAMFMRIEDFLVEIEDLETAVYEGRHMTKAKELKSRLSTLQRRFAEASRLSQNVVDQAVLDVDLLLLSITTYRAKLKEYRIGDADEGDAAKAAILHPVAIGKRAKARQRERARTELRRQRDIRTGRSYQARKASDNEEARTDAD